MEKLSLLQLMVGSAVCYTVVIFHYVVPGFHLEIISSPHQYRHNLWNICFLQFGLLQDHKWMSVRKISILCLCHTFFSRRVIRMPVNSDTKNMDKIIPWFWRRRWQFTANISVKCVAGYVGVWFGCEIQCRAAHWSQPGAARAQFTRSVGGHGRV